RLVADTLLSCTRRRPPRSTPLPYTTLFRSRKNPVGDIEPVAEEQERRRHKLADDPGPRKAEGSRHDGRNHPLRNRERIDGEREGGKLRGRQRKDCNTNEDAKLDGERDKDGGSRLPARAAHVPSPSKRLTDGGARRIGMGCFPKFCRPSSD